MKPSNPPQKLPPKPDPTGKIGGFDTATIIAFLDQWLESRKESLRGPTGLQGLQGIQGLEGKPGGSGIAANVDEIAGAVLKKLPPLYIGAKDANGKVTMQAVPVDLGDTIYIRVEPPALKKAEPPPKVVE